MDVNQRLRTYLARTPQICPTAYVAPNAVVLGAVTLGKQSSVWYHSVLRGDINEIGVGARTNIQDGSIVHVADEFATEIGEDVTCGHRAIVHACRVRDRVLIGMGATILDGADVGSDCIIGAHALVTKGMIIPAGSLVLGSPAKIVRALDRAEIEHILQLADKYCRVASHYQARS